MYNINPISNWVEKEEDNLKLNEETQRMIERNDYTKRIMTEIFPSLLSKNTKEIKLTEEESFALLIEKLECEAEYDKNNEDDDYDKLEWSHSMFGSEISKEVE